MCVCGQTIFPQSGVDSIQSDLDSPALKYLLNGEKRPRVQGERAPRAAVLCLSLLLLIKQPRSKRGREAHHCVAMGEPTPLRPARPTLDLYVEDVCEHHQSFQSDDIILRSHCSLHSKNS